MTTKPINFRLSTKNRDKLKEELEYEEKNLATLITMKQTPIIIGEIEQTKHMINRINKRLNKPTKKQLIKQIEDLGYELVSGVSFDEQGDNCIVWQAEKGEEFFEQKTLKGLLKLIQN